MSDELYGRVFYEASLRYASINGYQVVGRVRLLIDHSDDTAYIQIISMDDKVLVTHYVQPMSFLAPNSAAGVAWSTIPYKPECVIHSDDLARRRSSHTFPVTPTTAVQCGKVEIAQCVFMTPGEAQKFKTILDAIRSAFEAHGGLTAPIAPSGGMADWSIWRSESSSDESAQWFKPPAQIQSSAQFRQYQGPEVSQSMFSRWKSFNNSQNSSQLYYQNQSFNGSNQISASETDLPQSIHPSLHQTSFHQYYRKKDKGSKQSKTKVTSQESKQTNLESEAPTVTESAVVNEVPSDSKAPSNAPSSINPILKSNQSSRANQSRATVAMTPMTPISEPVSEHSNIFQSTQNMRITPQPSGMSSRQLQSANRSVVSSRPESMHASNTDLQWKSVSANNSRTSRMSPAQSDPYAITTATNRSGEDPYSFPQDEILFFSEACLINLDAKTKSWQGIYKGILKVTRGQGNRFSIIIENNGHICNHHILTAESNIQPSCLSQYGFTFTAPEVCIRKLTQGKQKFLLSFKSRAPYDEFKTLAADMMECLVLEQNDEKDLGESDCCFTNICDVKPPPNDWPCVHMPLGIPLQCEDNGNNVYSRARTALQYIDRMPV